jgi:hypothetical protein
MREPCSLSRMSPLRIVSSWLPNGRFARAGLAVRIRLPPAESRANHRFLGGGAHVAHFQALRLSRATVLGGSVVFEGAAALLYKIRTASLHVY